MTHSLASPRLRGALLRHAATIAGFAACAAFIAGCGNGSDPDARESAAGVRAPTERLLATAAVATTRYVRLEAVSEVNGNPWASVAELNLFDASGAPIPRTAWSVSADSEERVGEYAPALRAIDGDPNTFWHTQWQGNSPPMPHALTINLGASFTVGGFKYLPRQVGVNGRISNWRFSVSPDAVNWSLVAQGAFPNVATEQTITFAAVNQPPSLAPVADQSGQVGQATTLQLAGSDPDADPLSYAASGLPAGLGIASQSGLISGTPGAAGTSSVTVTVSDGRTGTASRSFQWTISAATQADRPPLLDAVADRSGIVGQSAALTLTASDPDGDPLTFSAAGLPNGLALDARSGRIAGTPTAAGSFVVTVAVADGRGGTASRNFGWSIAAGVTTGAVQYVRFEAVSEVNGNPWASIAELNLLDANGTVLSRSGWTVTADSQELVGEQAPATNAVDGDPSSFWHTQWQGGSPAMPHALTINLGNPRAIGGFRYLPRQVGVNGRIAGWRFYTSGDGRTWTQVAQGSFANTSDEQGWVASAAAPPPMPNAARAARIAAFASGPSIAATAWRASDAVTVDAVRRLSSGQHLFYSVAGTTGSTAPVVGGNTADGRPIADGTATAYVNGRVLQSTKADAPVVSAAASAGSAGLTLTGFATGDSQPARFTTVQGCKSVSTGTSFVGHYCYANGPAGGSGNATAYASGPYGAGLSPSYVYHSNGWEEEFVVTDRAFGLVFANSNSPVDVEIDGVQVQAGPTISTGAEGWTLVFDYQGVVRRRTVRVISAAGSIGPALRGVALTGTGQVEAAPVATDQVLVLGDSINATVTPPSEAGAQMMSYWLERDLGFGGAINMAVGGSGYISQNTNTFNLPNLLANPANRTLITQYAPNITHVVIGAGFNDRFRPVADVQAAALATWRTVRALLPNAKISITDGWSGSSGPDANALQLAAALATTFAQWGDGNARLIRSVGTSSDTAYVNGTGNAGIPVTSGNASVYTSTDGVHPSPAGARYIARRLADDITAAWGGNY